MSCSSSIIMFLGINKVEFIGRSEQRAVYCGSYFPSEYQRVHAESVEIRSTQTNYGLNRLYHYY